MSKKIILITGASSGIGRDLATLLAQGGCDVILVARSQEALGQIAADLSARYKVTTTVMPMDLSEPDASACSGKGCVGRYNVATGAVTDAVTYPASTHLGVLLGPYPTVILFPSTGHVVLERIG